MLSSAVGYHVVINTKGNLVEVSFMDSYCEYKETNKLLQRQNKHNRSLKLQTTTI